jgi:hypothetical protein
MYFILLKIKVEKGPKLEEKSAIKVLKFLSNKYGHYYEKFYNNK